MIFAIFALMNLPICSLCFKPQKIELKIILKKIEKTGNLFKFFQKTNNKSVTNDTFSSSTMSLLTSAACANKFSVH
jgi:hypothetical protein